MTTWYAQNSSVNIDSANQWNDVSDGSGNWLTWASLGITDILQSNGKTAIAINCNFTCSQVNNTGGGGFTIDTDAGTYTVTANAQGGTTGATNCILASGTGTFNLIGNATGGGTNNYIPAIKCSTAGCTINITGNVTGGASFGAHGVEAGAAIAINVTGNVTGGSGLSYGISSYSTTTLTITGTVSGGSGSAEYRKVGIFNPSTGVCTINGKLINTASACAINGQYILNAAAADYIQCTAPGSTTVKMAKEVAAANLLKDVVNGTVTGTFDEAARNTDPGEANVKSGETYKIQNVSKTGTYSAAGGGRPAFGDRSGGKY
jgi:hypothetical protein